jgi:hypothetical protein
MRCAGGGITPSSFATSYQLGSRATPTHSPPLHNPQTPRNLRIAHERFHFRANVASERSRELVSIEEKDAVNRRKDRRHRSARLRIGNLRCDRLTLILRHDPRYSNLLRRLNL